MFKRFLWLEWKSFFRSASVGKNIGLKVLLIFLALYFSVAFLVLGIGLYPLLRETFPDKDPLQMVNRLVLLWVVFDLGFRFMMQSLPVLDIKPLLNLPIARRKAVNFVLIKSMYSFFNFLPLFIIIPFGIFCIYKADYGTWNLIAWMMTMIAITQCVNFLNFIIKKKFTDNLKALIPAILILIVFAVLEYFEIFEASLWFGKMMNFLVINPYLTIVPLILVFALYKWNQLNLTSKFYLDAGLKEKQKDANTHDFVWTKKFGTLAPFLQQDLKLIWRNKRPKTTIYMSLILLGYGMFFYPNDAYQEFEAFYVFVGIFMTGIFMINFGQFVPSWDASYYPMIMSQNIPMKDYLASKALLISISVVILAILTTPYIYFGWNILLINMVAALYNIGVNVPILLYAGSFNKKKIDLDKSPFMNYQGTGATQWLVSIPLMVVPVFIFWLFDFFIGFEAAIIGLAAFGVIGLLFRANLMDYIVGAYRKRKHAMINGFKQTGE
ncbi:hypothetical protein DET49_11282 [Salegentibacter sp. 24]|jgi:hypothetical protein|uniref:DUF5687 family protein n=1 Tax=Salegentibacter sp. 24 TaxID=2183986 RepID=UPI0010612003|nr:DUF5687 family protein [Salegentibacter sp. 24]TDN87392.1 hypothetical protein DET49_11282 [Salegentibacter sp. 24]